MGLRRSYTAVIERNVRWQGAFVSEPYEAAWASEAIYFLRALALDPGLRATAQVQISADGIHWADEGSSFALPSQPDAVCFCKVRHFGGWLRLRGEVVGGGAITVLVALALKE